MTDLEAKQWIAVTKTSQYQWTEDESVRRNGRGALYYFGGESGVYLRIQPNGMLSVGTYEGAYPHIGEACFTQEGTVDCGSFNQAFQRALEVGGMPFLRDIFSQRPSQELIEVPKSPGMEMSMM